MKNYLLGFIVFSLLVGTVAFAQSNVVQTSDIDVKKIGICGPAWKPIWKADITLNGPHNGTYSLSKLEGELADIANLIQRGCDVQVVISPVNTTTVGRYTCSSISANSTSFSCTFSGHEKEKLNGNTLVFNPMLYVWNPVGDINEDTAELWTKATNGNGEETTFVPRPLNIVPGGHVAHLSVWAKR